MTHRSVHTSPVPFSLIGCAWGVQVTQTLLALGCVVVTPQAHSHRVRAETCRHFQPFKMWALDEPLVQDLGELKEHQLPGLGPSY